MAKRKKGWPKVVENVVFQEAGRKKYRPYRLKANAAPLTKYLFQTLEKPDSVVEVPLTGRRKAMVISNLRGKATKMGAKLGYAVRGEVLYGWLEKREM